MLVSLENSQSHLAPVDPPDHVGDEHSYRPKKGVKKKILAVGTGSSKPKSPSIATVTYIGYLLHDEDKKEQFENIAAPVTIELGSPGYPEGFVAGVENMKRGEWAEVTMTGRYGFRTALPERLAGREKELVKVPLVYEIKLIDFVLKSDLSGGRKVVKTVRQEGELGRIPGDSDEVKGRSAPLIASISEPHAVAEGRRTREEAGLVRPDRFASARRLPRSSP